MEIIHDATGRPIHTSKNLAGIKRYVSKNVVSVVELIPLGRNGALLLIYFDNGSFYTTHFASYNVLLQFVRKWKSIYGAPLIIDRFEVGIVSKDNPHLL